MNPVSGSSPVGFTSQLPQKLEDLKQKYNDLSPEEQNTVQNNLLDRREEVTETRQENKDQLRSGAVGLYSMQLAKNNAELFLNQSFDQETEIGGDVPPAAAANVYKSVQRYTLVNSDLYQDNINSVIDNRNQPPGVEPAPPEEAAVAAEPAKPAGSSVATPGSEVRTQSLDEFV